MLEWVPQGLRNPMHPNLTIVVGTLAIFVIGWLLHAILIRHGPERDIAARTTDESPPTP